MSDAEIFQLYRTELEVQNQELRSSRELLEETLDLYASLYDFAAVACLSLDHGGCIRELNLTGARLLDLNRDRAIGMPLARLLASESLPAFFSHIRKCSVKGNPRVATRLALAQREGEPRKVLLLSVRAPEEFLRNHDEDGMLRYQSSLIDLGDFVENEG